MSVRRPPLEPRAAAAGHATTVTPRSGGQPLTSPGPTVAAVVVNYRRYDLAERCVVSLQDSTRPPDAIAVVDNATRPSQLSKLAGRFPAVRTIANADNVGYAIACNQGRRALDADLILFVNPDVTVERDCLRRCVDVAAGDPSIGIVTCRLARPDGRLDHACHRGIPTPGSSLAYALRLHRLFPTSRRLARYTMSWLDPATEHDVEACSGAFMLVRRDVLDAVGGWDERYWFYAEDIDLCLRVARAGKRVRYVGTATAVHLKGASSRLRTPDRRLRADERAHKRRVQAAIVDSHQRFFRQHIQPTTPRFVSLAVLALFAIQRARIRLATQRDAARAS